MPKNSFLPRDISRDLGPVSRAAAVLASRETRKPENYVTPWTVRTPAGSLNNARHGVRRGCNVAPRRRADAVGAIAAGDTHKGAGRVTTIFVVAGLPSEHRIYEED